MSSRYVVRRQGEACSGGIAMYGRQVMVAHQTLRNKDHFLRGASAMAVDFDKFGSLSDPKYREAIVEPLASVRAQTQPELKIAERVAAYNAGDMSKIARIEKCEEERRKWKAYHHKVRKYRARVSKASSSKGNNPS